MVKNPAKEIKLPVQTACELQALLERIDLVLRPIMDQLPGSEVTDIWPPRGMSTEIVPDTIGVTDEGDVFNTLGTFPARPHPMASLDIEILFDTGRRVVPTRDDYTIRALYDMDARALRDAGVVGWRYVQ